MDMTTETNAHLTNRYKWAPLKSRKIIYNPPMGPRELHRSTPRPPRKISHHGSGKDG